MACFEVSEIGEGKFILPNHEKLLGIKIRINGAFDQAMRPVLQIVRHCRVVLGKIVAVAIWMRQTEAVADLMNNSSLKPIRLVGYQRRKFHLYCSAPRIRPSVKSSSATDLRSDLGTGTRSHIKNEIDE